MTFTAVGLEDIFNKILQVYPRENVQMKGIYICDAKIRIIYTLDALYAIFSPREYAAAMK